MAKEGEKYTAMGVTCVRVRAQEEEDERAARSVGQKGQGGNAAQRKKKGEKKMLWWARSRMLLRPTGPVGLLHFWLNLLFLFFCFHS
jgi:hypothetical protein